MATRLGNKLKRERERLGLSRSEIARRADIDAAHLFRVENYDNARPKFSLVVRVAKALGVSLDALARHVD